MIIKMSCIMVVNNMSDDSISDNDNDIENNSNNKKENAKL